jgi:hypothetical protein
VPGEERPLQLRDHGLVEPDDPGKSLLARAHPGQQVAPDLVLDGLVTVPAGPQFAHRRDRGMGSGASVGVGLVV